MIHIFLILFACAPHSAGTAVPPVKQRRRNATVAEHGRMALHNANLDGPLPMGRVKVGEVTAANGEVVPVGHPSLAPLEQELRIESEELSKWISPWVIKRHQHDHSVPHRRNIKAFFQSAGVLDISFIVGTVILFVWMYGFYTKWPSTKTPHWLLLLSWTFWGLACTGTVWAVDGRVTSTRWITGYLLELIFSVENVFIFHAVCQAFKAPAHLTQKALFVVVLAQIAFQAIFFMGLATWLHRSQVLPYLLGMWLLYVGACTGNGHIQESYDVRETCMFRVCNAIMGKRLSPEFPKDGHMFFHTREGLAACTMLLPLTVCLVFVDVLFEVDVTLTKIETLNNNFLDFSSSVVAASAVPELYFVARKLFEKYQLLRYGIAFVLVFYGVQLLFHSLFELPTLWGILVVISVMLICVSLSDKSNIKDLSDSSRSSSSIIGSDYTTQSSPRKDDDSEKGGAHP